MANVGDDFLGSAIIAFLKDRDPALAQFIRVKASRASSYTIVLSPQKVDRIFLHCTGTNATFGATDIDYDLAAQGKIFHLGYPPILPRLIVRDGAELADLLRQVYATGTLTSLDTSLPDPDGATSRVDWHKLLENTLPYVDIFIPSLEEILFMLRRSDYDRWRGHFFAEIDRNYLDDLTAELLRLGRSAVVGFKLGEYGIYLRTGERSRFERWATLPIDMDEWADRRIWHPAFAVEVAGTTGAGDSAYAGFLTGLIKGLSLNQAARWACAVGACNVESADATSGVQSWEDTQHRLDAGWSALPHRLAGF